MLHLRCYIRVECRYNMRVNLVLNLINQFWIVWPKSTYDFHNQNKNGIACYREISMLVFYLSSPYKILLLINIFFSSRYGILHLIDIFSSKYVISFWHNSTYNSISGTWIPATLFVSEYVYLNLKISIMKGPTSIIYIYIRMVDLHFSPSNISCWD